MDSINSDFYSNLPILDSFFEVSSDKHYKAIPDNWYVGVTDIMDSSSAILNNQYKTVNLLGASPIVGFLNEYPDLEIPFTFGGDGCAICFPPELTGSVQGIFSATQSIAKKDFGLNLRAAIIPVKKIREDDFDIRVARFKVSEFYTQAVFTGGGLTYAEEILKSEQISDYDITYSEQLKEVDFSGLECRWQEISEENKFVYSILIETIPGLENAEEVYNNILHRMREDFGFDSNSNPVKVEKLNMNLSPDKLSDEVKFRTTGKSWVKKIAYLIKIQIRILLGKYFMKFGKKTSETDWSLYKADMAKNNDHRKFDDMLRLVISGTKSQFEAFEGYLEDLYLGKKIVYGIHKSDSALITCMVFAWHKQHIHFVDGSKGGYVAAALDLKRRKNLLKY